MEFTLLVQWSNTSPVETFTFQTGEALIAKFREVKARAKADRLTREGVRVWAFYGRQVKLTPDKIFLPNQDQVWGWVDVDEVPGSLPEYAGAIFR